MQPQQQMVMTNAGPVYLGQPYQTTSVISSYRDRQSSIIGALLIIAGSLSIIFSIVAIAIISNYYWSYYSIVAVCDGIWCGVMVSIIPLVYKL